MNVEGLLQMLQQLVGPRPGPAAQVAEQRKGMSRKDIVQSYQNSWDAERKDKNDLYDLIDKLPPDQQMEYRQFLLDKFLNENQEDFRQQKSTNRWNRNFQLTPDQNHQWNYDPRVPPYSGERM